jgi:hypothetical protein
MEVNYYNRYNDKLVFKQTDEETVVLEGAKYFRVGYDTDDKTIEFVDPSGGPYLNVGTNLRFIFQNFKDIYITKIDINKDVIIFTVKTDS